jgi:hypothetical protein
MMVGRYFITAINEVIILVVCLCSCLFCVLFPVAQSDHSDCDCFLLAVLSHGEMGIIHARDIPYKPESLWTPFTADKCPTLAGKPKLFFLQVRYC